mmetsp:Transcript_51791/g.59147  ORF Transcript_51791/g.59147 Transcript_51791/m.59147 type:complete len:80 (+) Transcript_51791:203-442(+)
MGGRKSGIFGMSFYFSINVKGVSIVFWSFGSDAALLESKANSSFCQEVIKRELRNTQLSVSSTISDSFCRKHHHLPVGV